MGLLALGVRRQIPVQRRLLRAFGETQGLALQILGAVPKLRVAHAEDRAFARWAAGLGRTKEAFVDSQRIAAGVGAFAAAWQAFALAMILLIAGTLEEGSLSAGEFVAFTTAFGATAAALLGLVSLLSTTSQAVVLCGSVRGRSWTPRPRQRRAPPTPAELVGEVELAHVSFRYGDGPLVLDDVSLTARARRVRRARRPVGLGQVDAAAAAARLRATRDRVGLLRRPGPRRPRRSRRPPAARRRDPERPRCSRATIFHNIVGAANLTLDDAWEAARIAGLADDIARMPMGMHTFVADGGAAFSGGQRQRLLIARAVVGATAHPALRRGDERARQPHPGGGQRSARDLQATRDRDRPPAVARSGTPTGSSCSTAAGSSSRARYDELMERGGLFATLARRQIA